MADDRKQQQGGTATATLQAPVAKPFMFLIEVATNHNNSILWPVNQRKLRGRWDRDKFPRGSVTDDEFSKMPNPIPGMYIEVDSAKRMARIFDILGDENPKVQSILKRIEEVIKASGVADRARIGPDKTETLTKLDDNELKTWAYYARRFLDNRCVEIKKGAVPTMEEIEALPGLTRREIFDQSPLKPEYSALPKRYKAPEPDEPTAGDDVSDVFDLAEKDS